MQESENPTMPSQNINSMTPNFIIEFTKSRGSHTMSHTVTLVLLFSMAVVAMASQMVICDYDIIVHRWLAFSTNETFLDHDNATVKMNCNRLRDLYRDPEFEKDEWAHAFESDLVVHDEEEEEEHVEEEDEEDHYEGEEEEEEYYEEEEEEFESEEGLATTNGTEL